MYDPDKFPAEWQSEYVTWRVSRGGQLDAIAHAVKNEGIWRLICDLMESAVQTGWEAASVGEPEPASALEARAPDRELVGSGYR